MRRLVLVALVMACRQPDVDDILIEDGGGAVFFDATTDASDATVMDAEGGVTFNGGGPFMCGGCICDGTLYFCAAGGGTGPAPFDLDASDAEASSDASACVPDAGPPYCKRIPIECLPKPSCDCLVSNPGTCFCLVDPTGNGLETGCITHP